MFLRIIKTFLAHTNFIKKKLEYIEDKRASKMARIEEVKAGNDNSGVLVKKVQEEIEDAKKYNSAVMM